jgi:hypothetical protein
MNCNQHIENIIKSARNCSDPEELRLMAKLLRERSAYREAQHLEQRAKEVERKFAEEAAK